VRVHKKMVKQVAAILIVGFLFFVPAYVQPCHTDDLSKNRCCYCESCCHFLEHNEKDKKECSCQISEGSAPESSSAVIVTHPDNKPKINLGSLKVEFIDKCCFTQLSDLSPYTSVFLSRDPPLYLLHSSFLI